MILNASIFIFCLWGIRGKLNIYLPFDYLDSKICIVCKTFITWRGITNTGKSVWILLHHSKMCPKNLYSKLNFFSKLMTNSQSLIMIFSLYSKGPHKWANWIPCTNFGGFEVQAWHDAEWIVSSPSPRFSLTVSKHIHVCVTWCGVTTFYVSCETLIKSESLV